MPVTIGERATMQCIDGLRTQVLEALQMNDAIDLDCSALVEGDLSLLQLVEATRRQAVRDQKALRLLPAGQPVLAALLDRAGFPDSDPFWRGGEQAR